MAVKVDGVPAAVLKLCCEKAVETDNMHMVDSHALLDQAHSLGITDGQVFDALEVLFECSYVKPLTLSKGHIRHFEVAFDCFEAYATAHLLNYQELIQNWRGVLPTRSVCLTVPIVPPRRITTFS